MSFTVTIGPDLIGLALLGAGLWWMFSQEEMHAGILGGPLLGIIGACLILFA